MSFELKKNERLCSKKRIEELLNDGQTLVCYPIRCKYLIKKTSPANISQIQESPLSPHFDIQILTAVPKRNFKKAVDRNYIKRMIRESYRLNKAMLTSSQPQGQVSISILFHYIDRHIVSYDLIDEKIKLLITRLNKIMNQHEMD